VSAANHPARSEARALSTEGRSSSGSHAPRDFAKLGETASVFSATIEVRLRRKRFARGSFAPLRMTCRDGFVMSVTYAKESETVY